MTAVLAAFGGGTRTAGLTGNMGRVGACQGSAAMESFFSLLQKNILNRQRGQTRELRLAIVVWIERTYRRRRQDALGRLAQSSSRLSTRPLTQPDRPCADEST